MCSDTVKNVWGYFGKVPSKGDFVYAGVEPALRKVFFEWQEAVLTVSREQLGQQWGEKFLNAPIWHFAMTNILDEKRSHIGSMIPSVDNSGRYFFFTLLQEIDSPPMAFWLDKSWSQKSEETILEVLADEFELEHWVPELPVQALEKRLDFSLWKNRNQPISNHLVLKTPSLATQSNEIEDFTPWIEALVSSHYCTPIYWWTEGSYAVEPTSLITSGLPAVGQFSAMLDGDWSTWSW